MSTKAVHLENITYFYPNTQEAVLQEISLSIDYGEFVVMAGPSGGGKSTLCRIIVGLIPRFYGGKLCGKVYVDGIDVTKADIRDVIERVGVVFQNPENQVVNLVVEEEIAFVLENLLYDRNEVMLRVEEVLRKLGIGSLRRRATYSLSGGEVQKVTLGSILAVKPKIIILDEPLAHLDPPSAIELIKFLSILNKEEGKTVIVIEHRVSELLRYATRLVILDKKIVYDGDPRDALALIDDIDKVYGVEVPPIAKLSKTLNTRQVLLDLGEVLGIARSINFSNRLDNTTAPLDNNYSSSCREKAIVAENLWHIYGNGVEALKGVDIEVCRGEFVAIVGGNGSGKTTLIKHFNGLLKPTKGKVLVFGIDTAKRSVAELAKYVGIVFQNPLHQFFRDTVYEEAMFTAKSMGIQNAEEKVLRILKKFGLSHLLNRSPYEISAGEQRRVAIASTLVYDPEVVVLDEPTAGIDFRLKLELLEVLVKMWGEGKTIVITTHDIEFLAYTPAQKVVVLDRGRVVAFGDPRKVFYSVLTNEMFLPQVVRFVKKVGIERKLRPLNINELLSLVKRGQGYE